MCVCIDPEARGGEEREGSRHVRRAEGHDLFVQELFQLFTADVVFVHCVARETSDLNVIRDGRKRRTIELEEFRVKRGGARLIIGVMLRIEPVKTRFPLRSQIHLHMPQGMGEQVPPQL